MRPRGERGAAVARRSVGSSLPARQNEEDHVNLRQILRLVIGVVLIPVCVASVIAFWNMMAHGVGGLSALALLIGAGAYIGVFLFFHDSIERTFFSREPVRRLWGTITGYQGPSQRVAGSDDVRLDGEGRVVPLYIILVPYAVPLYTILGILAVWLLNRFLLHMKPGTYSIVQAFVLGITYMFHLFLVGYDIRRKHPDLRAGGYLFTLVVMLLVNAQVLAAVSMLAFDADFIKFNQDLLGNLRGQYRWFGDLVRFPFK